MQFIVRQLPSERLLHFHYYSYRELQQYLKKHHLYCFVRLNSTKSELVAECQRIYKLINK